MVPLVPFSMVGVERTVMEQFPPGATLLPHVVECVNWPPPCNEIDEIVSAVAPVLVRVTVCGALLVSRTWATVNGKGANGVFNMDASGPTVGCLVCHRYHNLSIIE